MLTGKGPCLLPMAATSAKIAGLAHSLSASTIRLQVLERGIRAMQFPLRPSFFQRIFLLICALIIAVSFTPAAIAATDSKPIPKAQDRSPSSQSTVMIHGPLRSFLRMAGVSQQASIEEVLPLFARNVYAQGYVGWKDRAAPTEFLILLGRYVNQTKELSELAGPSGNIHLARCEDAAPLLRIFGYPMRQQCGDKDTSLFTPKPG